MTVKGDNTNQDYDLRMYQAFEFGKQASELSGEHIGSLITARYVSTVVGSTMQHQLRGEITMITHRKDKRVRVRVYPSNRDVVFNPSDIVGINYRKTNA